MTGAENNAVEIPVTAVESVKETGSELSVRTSEGTVQMSQDVMTNLSSGAEKVSVSVSKQDVSQLDENRQELLRDKHVVSFTAQKDGEDVHELGGRVTASIPYTPAEGMDTSDLRMYYMGEDGKSHLMRSHFDATLNQMVMETDHFSVYYVGSYSEEGNGTGYVEPEDDTMLYIGAAVGLIAVVAIAAIFVLRKN